MKKPVYLLLGFALLLTACKKDKTNDQLSGTWRLMEVYDKNTGTTSLEPAGATRGVVIQFSNGRFSGHTLANSIWDGRYTLAGNTVKFGGYSTTDALEESWGGSFCTVLSACLLQSVSPCAPSDFTITGNTLKINSPLRYNITLTRQ